MYFRPLHDRVVIEALEQEEKTPGGIIVPDTAQEKPMRGKVLVTGPGARGEDGALIPMEVKKGDTVLYGKYSGTEVKIDDTEVLIMREGDVMGIIG
jgi:chaperonin GroES